MLMILKELFGLGKGSNYGGNGKNNSRFCTHCDIYVHNVKFCYKKHVHSDFNKSNSSSFVNATNNALLGTQNSNTNLGTNSADHTNGLTQEKYNHLV